MLLRNHSLLTSLQLKLSLFCYEWSARLASYQFGGIWVIRVFYPLRRRTPQRLALYNRKHVYSEKQYMKSLSLHLQMVQEIAQVTSRVCVDY